MDQDGDGEAINIAPVEKFLEKRPLRFAVAIDSKGQPTWHAFSVAAIPAMDLIDGTARIVGEWKGAIEVENVRRAVRALLTEAAPD